MTTAPIVFIDKELRILNTAALKRLQDLKTEGKTPQEKEFEKLVASLEVVIPVEMTNVCNEDPETWQGHRLDDETLTEND